MNVILPQEFYTSYNFRGMISTSKSQTSSMLTFIKHIGIFKLAQGHLLYEYEKGYLHQNLCRAEVFQHERCLYIYSYCKFICYNLANREACGCIHRLYNA